MSEQIVINRWHASCTALLSIVLVLVWGASLSAVQPLHAAYASRTRARASATQGSIDTEALEDFLDDFFAERMAEFDVPGAAFVLVKDGEVILIKGYGYADLDNEVPVDAHHTIFRIGSTSKLLTATAVMQLVEEGKIDLHADVNRYLDTFRIPDTYPEPVTMAHLLTHTGGFDERLIGAFARTPEEMEPLGAYLAERMPPRVMPPGEVTSYSNHGLALAGYIVEVVSGMPFEQYVAAHILQPLSMTHSSFAQPLPSDLRDDLSVAYPQNLEAGPMLYASIAPAGMLSTTAQDMAHFLIAHLQSGRYNDAQILDEATAELMHQRQFANHPGVPGWAYGFTERTENGQRVLDHGGADPTGFGSMLVLLPEQNVGFFAVTNTRFRDEVLIALSGELIDYLYPGDQLPSEDPAPLPGFEARAARVSGTYITNRHARNTIGKLSLLTAPSVRVQPAEGDTGVLTVTGLGGGTEPSRWVEIEPLLYQHTESEARIAFREDVSGHITHLFARGHTPGAFDKAAWYQNPTLHQALLGVCTLIFLTVALGWPLAGLIRRLRNGTPRSAPAVQHARGVALGVSVLSPLFLVLLVVLTGANPLQFGVPMGVRVLLGVPLLITAMTVALPILGARAWSEEWSLLGRLHYVSVTVAAFAFVWFLYVWNLLGFRF